MALKPCRECGKEVSTEAAACPHCGVPEPTADPAQPRRQARPRRGVSDAERRRARIFVRYLLPVLIIVFGAWVANEERRDERVRTELRAAALVADSVTPRDRRIGKELDAQVLCERYVREKTGTPTTVKFRRGETDAEHKGGGTYLVTGGLDAQNLFGAMVRYRYVCIVTTENGRTWTRDDVVLLGP